MLRPYAQYAEPVLPPPDGAELVEDWQVFYELARRLDVPLTLDGVPLDMSRRPSTEDLLRLLTRGSQVPFEQLRAATRGRVFDVPRQWVEPAEPGCAARFAVAPPDVLDELHAVRAEDVAARAGAFRLAVRRLRDVQNTMYHSVEAVARRVPRNTACMHPDDLDALRLVAGDDVEIATPAGVIRLPVAADDSVRRGVVSVPHGWGDLVDHEPAPRARPMPGVNTNVLTSSMLDCEPINAMPCLTGLRIDVRAAPLSSSPERPS
jgi:anaerobic selenocysteine-containing dehydrogenase